MANNYILFDGPPAKDFIDGLEKDSHMQWQPLSCDGRSNVPKWRRLVNYFLFPLRFLLTHRNIGHVVAWQQFYGITTAFYNSIITLHKKMDITIMTFIYNPKQGVAGRIFNRYVNRAICSKNVSNIVVFSQSEVAYYSRLFPHAAAKFKHLPLGIGTTGALPPVTKGDYIFTTGMSNRDYGFLCNALKGTHYKVKIACPGVKVPAGTDNIEVLSDCYEDEMLRQMAECRVVVIPLRDKEVSSGQLVLLQAMLLGKPVIVTRTHALSPYIEEGKSAITIENTADELLDALDELYNDDAKYAEISKIAAEKVRQNFSEHTLGSNIGHLIAK